MEKEVLIYASCPRAAANKEIKPQKREKLLEKEKKVLDKRSYL